MNAISDLEFLSLLVFEATFALNLGDTECDGDLECLLIFLFEHSLELNLGDTERDGDLEALLLLFSKLLWNYILETLNVMVTSNVCYSFFLNLLCS